MPRVGLLLTLAKWNKLGSGGTYGFSVLRFGESHIEFGQRPHSEFNLARAFADQVGEVSQDAIYLFPFFKLEFAPGVIEFDDG